MNNPSSENLINILADLVGFPSVSGDFVGTEDCFRYCRRFLTDRGLKTSLIRSNDYPSIFAATKDTKEPKILLQAHLDVVPSSEEGYILKRQDGKLIGRGTFDMKFAGACYLQLIEDLKDELDHYDFGIMFTSDEEIGGEDGVKHLLETGFGADVCVLPDGANNWKLEASCNGAWIVKITAKGATTHGSRPWEGENAINKLLECLAEIKTRFKYFEPNQNSLVVSQIFGGTAINQVPSHAEVVLDMRFIDKKEHTAHQAIIKEIVTKHNLEIETLTDCAPVCLDIEHPEIIRFKEIATKLRGKPLEEWHSLGASDARYFDEYDIPCIILRPSGYGAHSEDEWLDEAEFIEFYEFLKAYVMEASRVA